MNLTKTPETMIWPQSHYVFIERVGPFQETAPACWGDLHKVVPQISESNQITGYTSLYKVSPQMIYRAGVTVSEKPKNLPAGVSYEYFPGGKYAYYTLTGPYDLLPEACGQVFERVEKEKIPVADGYFIENYVNSPATTAPENLITQIMFPTV